MVQFKSSSLVEQREVCLVHCLMADQLFMVSLNADTFLIKRGVALNY